MKTFIAATLIGLSLVGGASASELQATVAAGQGTIDTQAALLDNGVYTPGHDSSTLLQARWLSRYGKWCYHGPVYIRACH